MKRIGLLMLRVTMGWLMVMWGLDKLVNVEHGVRVANAFYFGLGASSAIQSGFGVLQIALGVLIVLGLWRRTAYPALTLITAATAIGVWRSIVDPWGWVLEGANVLFYPSAIILSAAIVLWGTIDQDALALDARRR